MNRKKLLQEQNFIDAQNRARGVAIGTAFGGVTEVSMRRADGTFTYAILQPVEVIEIIHQLAANVGCHLHLTPRRDFAAWRDWKYTEAELAHYRGVQHLSGVGHPPHANDMAPHAQIGSNILHPELQPGMPNTLEGNEDGETVAIETPKRRRKSKRTAKAA
jgi:hypothetical protein